MARTRGLAIPMERRNLRRYRVTYRMAGHEFEGEMLAVEKRELVNLIRGSGFTVGELVGYGEARVPVDERGELAETGAAHGEAVMQEEVD